MGKYSDSDIDAILKSIQENVDKQIPDTKAEDDNVETKSTKDASTPDELINLIMSGIGQKGEKAKKSEDSDKYDISGFEIEEIIEETAVDEVLETNTEAAFVEVDFEATAEAKQEEDADVTSDTVEDPAVEDGIEAEVDENLGGDEEIDLLNEEPVRNVLDNNAVEDSAFKDFFTELSADVKAIEGEHTVYTEDNVFEQHSDDTVEIDYTNESDAVEVGESNIICLNEKAHIEENTDVFCEKEVSKETVDDIETPFSKDFIDEDIGTPDSDAFDFDKSNSEDDKSVHRQLDEADINLALALGDKEHIETSIGFVKVREAKHNFVNPQERALHSTSATIHRKSEYKASDEDGEIKDAYRKEKKRIAWRFGTTAFVCLLLVFSELIISFESIYVPYVSEFLASPISYHIVSILLSVVAVAISVKKMLLGVVGFITNRPNYYTTVSVVAVINFVYSILIVTAFGDSGMILLNSVVVLGILLNIVGEYMHLVRETLTFKLISNPNPKISLEKFDKTPETVKKEDFLTGSDFYIESVASVGKYFERSAHRPESYHVRHAYMMITVLLSLLVSVIAVAVTNNFAYFLFACELSALLCIPTEFGVVGALPFFIISRKLYKLDSAIIGETIDDEYIGPNTVYMDDVEVFGNHGVRVINLEPHNGFNIVNVNYYFHSVFSGLKCPLKNAFGEIPAEMKISDNVSLVNVSDSGIEAVVDENCEVLIGTRNFMEENSVIVSKSTDAKASEKADVCVMYMAVNGALCAKMYLKYSINHHFEKFASDMTESHIRIGVRTLDPNVTSEMLGTLRNDSSKCIKIVRPSLNDLVPIERRSDSGIITAKNPHMIARILAEGLKVKRINFALNIVWVVYALLGICSVIAFSFFGIFDKILPIYIVGYRFLWSVLMTLYIINKLRNRKNR